MRLTILLIALFTSFCSWGQIFKLEVSNPAPRVGDAITISVALSKLNPDSINSKGKESLEDMFSRSENHIGDISFEISEWFLTEPGPLKVGPFQIPINDKVYLTNELKMSVSPKLPEDIIEGIWVRLLNFQGAEYILFEQRQPGSFKQKQSGGTSYSMSTEDVKWSELNIDKIERMGIEIEKKRTSSSIQSIAVGSALYRLIVYTYKPLPSFKGQLTIDKSLIWDMPKNGHIEIVRVKN